VSELNLNIERSIREHRLLGKGQALVVAVSGGLDSMVLLHALHELSAKHARRLIVVHFNHQLRGRSSDADEHLVRATAERFGLRFICERGDVRGFAKANKHSIEMAARQLRHEFLARTAREHNNAAIAVAHHADDQLELFFLRLLRGTGLEGLSGMDWLDHSPVDPQLRLIRPLLDTTKEQLRDYAKARRVKFREDATNALLDFQRNRIRHELIPLLKKHYQPALAKVALRFMEIVKAEDQFVYSEACKWLRKKHPSYASLGPALQRRLIQLQLREQNFSVDFDLIERLRAGEVVTMSPAISVFCDRSGDLGLRKISETFVNFEPKSVDLKDQRGNVLFNGIRIEWERSDWRAPKSLKSTPGSEVFDAQSIGTNIIVRHWRPGDRFQPIGMAVSVKLQDLFTNLKVPRDQRHKLILAATADGEIFWVEGLRIGERFKVRKNSKSVLHWAWQRLT
jgi:tRNA(Ile)-lysidine synthase